MAFPDELRLRGITLILAIAILGMAAWMARDVERHAGAAPQRQAAASGGASSRTGLPFSPSPAGPAMRMPMAPRLVEAPRATTHAAPLAASSPGPSNLAPFYDVCGIGSVQAVMRARQIQPASAPGNGASDRPAHTVFEPALPDGMGDDAMRAAWPRLLQALAGSPVPRRQAAAVLLQESNAFGDEAFSLPPWPMDRTRLHRLAGLALASSDPVVMRWAIAACSPPAERDACVGLSARHWIALEPLNLLAWLQLLIDEPAAEAEALNGMALARSASSGFGHLTWTVFQGMPAELPQHLRVSLAVVTEAVDGMLMRGDYQHLMQQCGPTRVADSNRRQLCQALAQVLAHESADLIGLLIGHRLLDQLSGSAVVYAPMRRDYDRWNREGLTRVLSHLLEQPYNCDTQAFWSARAEERDRLGEAGQFRAWRKAQSGLAGRP